MAIYTRGREFELGSTENKSSKWPERDSHQGLPDCESDALTIWPRRPLIRKKKAFVKINTWLNYVSHYPANTTRTRSWTL